MMPPEQVFELFGRGPGAFRRVPLATYRLQLDRTFTFRDALDAVGYLAPRAGVLPRAEACASFPVALLVREA